MPKVTVQIQPKSETTFENSEKKAAMSWKLLIIIFTKYVPMNKTLDNCSLI